MLGISTGYRIDALDGTAWVLRLEGRLQGEWVHELRRQWRRLRTPDDDTVRIRVELDDVEYVDRSGRLLLAEMQEAGVQVAWHDPPRGTALSAMEAPRVGWRRT